MKLLALPASAAFRMLHTELSFPDLVILCPTYE